MLIRWVRLFSMDNYMYKCLFKYILYIKIWKYTTTCPTKYKVPIYLLPKLEGSHKTCIYVCWICLVLLWFFAFGTFIICCSVWIFVIEFNLFLHRQQLVLEGWNHPPFFFKTFCLHQACFFILKLVYGWKQLETCLNHEPSTCLR